LLTIWPNGSYLHRLTPDLPVVSPPMEDQLKQSRGGKANLDDERLSLTIMVNWQNLQRKLLRDSWESSGESCHNLDGVTCARPHKE
jgi:hypothetical protein